MKKIIIFLFLASFVISISPVKAELTCENDNKILLPAGKVCCCTEIAQGSFLCTPTNPVDGTKCPEGKKKISTQKNDVCICKFTINKK